MMIKTAPIAKLDLAISAETLVYRFVHLPCLVQPFSHHQHFASPLSIRTFLGSESWHPFQRRSLLRIAQPAAKFLIEDQRMFP